MRRPLRRVAALAALLVAGISCGRDATGPVRGAMSAPIAFRPLFMGDAAQASLASGIDFAAVRVVVTRADSGRTVVVDRVVPFASTDTIVTLPLSVPFSSAATVDGELLLLSLAYASAAGDTVFRGGPAQVLARPAGASGAETPTEIATRYTGPGATAVRVVLSPDSVEVADLGAFSFTVQALDAQGATVPNAPIRLGTPDTTLITLTTNGAGIARSTRGVARVVATILTGTPDTSRVSVKLRASAIQALSGSAQTGTAGAALANPLVVRVTAADGVPVAGVTVTFTPSNGSGTTSVTSGVSDANGLVSTAWALGPLAGTQSVVASAAGLTGQAIFSATATAGVASSLVITSSPTSGTAVSALAPIVVQARDQFGNVSTTFTRTVSLALSTNPGNAILGGTVSVPAVGGIATFSGVTVNRPASGYRLVAVASDTSTSLSSAPSTAFSITTGPATTLAFVTPPSGATVGAPITPAVVVAAQDAAGNTVTSFTGAVTVALAANPGTATLGGTSSVNAVAGLATFSNLTLSAAGTGYTLAAAATGLTSVISPAFTTAPALIRWTNASGGSWWTASNWDAGRVPTSSDSVLIALDGTYTVTADSMVPVRSLAVGASSGTQTLRLQQNPSGSNVLTTKVSIGANADLQLVNVNIAGGDTVRLDGTLTLAGASQVNSPVTGTTTSLLRVAGGTLGVSNTSAAMSTSYVNRGTLELTAFGGWNAGLNFLTGGLTNAATGTMTTTGSGGARSLSGSVQNTGTITVGSGLQVIASTGDFANGGTIAVTGGAVQVNLAGTGTTFTNTGSIAIDSSSTVTIAGGTTQLAAGGTVSGLGYLTLQSTTATVASTITANLGVVEAVASLATPLDLASLVLSSATITGSSAIAVGPGHFLSVVASTVQTDVHLTGGYAVAAGSSNIGGTLTIAPNSVLSIAGGTSGATNTSLTLAQGLTNRGVIDLTANGGWSAGLTLTSGLLVNDTASAIFASNPGGVRTVQAPIENRGNIFALTDLTVLGTRGASLNSGVINASGGDVSFLASGTATGLVNTGAILIDSTRTVRVEGAAFASAPTASISGTGTLDLASVDATIDGALTANVIATSATLTHAQTLDVPELLLLSSTIDGAPVRVAPGHRLQAANGTVAGPLQLEGTAVLAGTSRVTGAVTTASTSVLTAIGGFLGATNAAVAFDSGFVNLGAIQLDNLGGWNAAIEVSSGTLVNEVGGTIVATGAGGTRRLGALLDNRGQLTALTGLLVETITGTPSSSGGIEVQSGVLEFHQGGTSAGLALSGGILVDSGATLAVNAGTLGIAAGSNVVGGGTLALFDANANIDASIGTRFTTRFGSISLNSSLIVPFASFTGSTISGDGGIVVPPGAELSVVGATVQVPVQVDGLAVLAGTASLAGSFSTSATSTVRVLSGTNGVTTTDATILPAFTNLGVLEIESIGGWNVRLSAPGGLTNAAGAFVRGVGSGGTRVLAGAFSNSGTIGGSGALRIETADVSHANFGLLDATAADLTLVQAGIEPGFVNFGTIATQAGRTFAVTGGFADFSVDGEVLGDGTVALTDVSATVQAQPDSVVGATVIVAGGSTFISGGIRFGSASFTNTSLVGDSILVEAGGSLSILGTSEVSNPLNVAGTLVLAGSPILSGGVATNGTSHLRILGGALGATNTVATFNAPLTNQGLLELEGSGGWGAQLTVANGAFQNVAGATVRTLGNGGGRAIAASTIENQGSLVLSPGTTSQLVLQGFFVGGGTSSLTMDIGTTGRDDLQIVGQTSLAGAFTLTALSGFTAPPATSYTLITSTGPRSGTFGSVTLPAGFNANPLYTSTGLTVTTP